MVYNLFFRLADPQTLNPRGNELCRMSLTFARIWRIPCLVWGVHSLATGENSNTFFILHWWKVCVVCQLTGKSSSVTSQELSMWSVKWGRSEPDPSGLTWEYFDVNKQLIGCWINASKQLRLNSCVLWLLGVLPPGSHLVSILLEKLHSVSWSWPHFKNLFVFSPLVG